ncbi:MAG: hypothetical protein AAF579_15260 [Cyanobacteria bacterium P01_C01_bin.118]
MPWSSSKAWPLLRVLLILNGVVVVLSAWAGIKDGNLQAYFDEESVVTWLSGLQLIAVAVVAMRMYRLRCQRRWSWKSPAFIWLLIAFGFVFLAADELLEIHEQLDKWLHTIGNIQETALTDRLDDAIVGGYGMLALGLVYGYRRELKRYRSVFPLMVASFIPLFVMVVLDLLTNRPDILPFLLGADTAFPVKSTLEVLEEFCKLMVSSFLLASIFQAFSLEKLRRTAAMESIATAAAPDTSSDDRTTSQQSPSIGQTD